MGTQKNRLNETVLLSTHNMFKFVGKQITTLMRPKILLKLTLNLFAILWEVKYSHSISLNCKGTRSNVLTLDFKSFVLDCFGSIG